MHRYEFDCKFAVASIDGEPRLVSMFIGSDSTFYYHFSASQGMQLAVQVRRRFFVFQITLLKEASSASRGWCE